jgi:hypothetical protein
VLNSDVGGLDREAGRGVPAKLPSSSDKISFGNLRMEGDIGGGSGRSRGGEDASVFESEVVEVSQSLLLLVFDASLG